MNISIKMFISLSLISCANVRHATNTNVREFKNISHDIKWQKQIDRDVDIMSEEKVKNCNFIQDYTAKDNVIDQGEKFAILYIKLRAKEVEGNALVIESSQKIGDYGHTVYGKIYHCDEVK